MHASSDDTRVECRTSGLTEIGATVNDRVEFCERKRREPLGESGGMLPRKISNLKALKRHSFFQRSQTDNCVKTKGSKTALSSAVIYFHN